MRQSGTRRLKGEVRTLLAGADWREKLDDLLRLPARKVVNPLLSLFYLGDSDLRWRAIFATGMVVSGLAERNVDSARVIMRRLMWTLNDESGGIGWGAPEAMGEIMARSAQLADEFAHILVAYAREDMNYLEHPVLQRGLLWGLGRLAHARPAKTAGCSSFILPFLDSSDPVHRGMGAWILQTMTSEPVVSSALARLHHDHHPLTIFIGGQLQTTTVSALAREQE